MKVVRYIKYMRCLYIQYLGKKDMIIETEYIQFTVSKSCFEIGLR